MPKARHGTIEIEFESFGDPSHPLILLINGLGSQMTRWPVAFCGHLTSHNYRAVRFDNRDVGKSTWFKVGQTYSLSDMARDAVAVIDAVGAEKAHVAGVSMGGMIGQALAIEHPSKVLSLTSIMSATGAPGTLVSKPQAAEVLTVAPPSPSVDFEAYLDHLVRNAMTIGSPGYPWPDGALRRRAADEYQRGYNPTGSARQMAAIRSDGDRTERLATLKIPAVVIHGIDDPLVPLGGGEATARAIPGAELRLIAGMGHDLPPSLYEIVTRGILTAAVGGDLAA